MIVSDMRHHSLFQNMASAEQSRVSHSVGGEPKSRPETVRENRSPSSSSVKEVPRNDSLGKLITRVDILKESLHKILTTFPPFFPIGTYQRLDLIMEIKGVQGEMAQQAAENRDLPPFTAPAEGEGLKETSNDGEIMSALQGMFKFRAEAGAVMKKQAEAAPLSIKV